MVPWWEAHEASVSGVSLVRGLESHQTLESGKISWNH